MTTEPRLLNVEVQICELCFGGAGGECHSPGCALFLNRAPDIPWVSAFAHRVWEVGEPSCGNPGHRGGFTDDDGCCHPCLDCKALGAQEV